MFPHFPPLLRKLRRRTKVRQLEVTCVFPHPPPLSTSFSLHPPRGCLINRSLTVLVVAPLRFPVPPQRDEDEGYKALDVGGGKRRRM